MRYYDLIQPLNELFDRPYPTQWEKSSDGYEVHFETKDQHLIVVVFDYWRPNLWVVSFKAGASWKLTRRGDEMRIFATVVDSIRKFIEKEKPSYIVFSSSKDEGSRTALYRRMVNRLASSAGYIDMSNKLDQIPNNVSRNWIKNNSRLFGDYDIFVLMHKSELEKPFIKDDPLARSQRLVIMPRAESRLNEESNDFIDNYKGAGAVPNNRDVDYFGMKVFVKPSTFLKLALPFNPDRNDVEKMKDYLSNGGKIGAPFFEIELPDSWLKGNFEGLPRIKGHEGRHRMLAISELWGDIPVETHLFFRGGLRARNLTTEIERALNEEIISESGRPIMGPWFR